MGFILPYQSRPPGLDFEGQLPLLLDLGQGRPGVKRADAGQELVVRQLAGIRHVDEDVEVVACAALSASTT